ncbi:hypothetical protein AMTR_s00090p00035360 [Amborella trichopoda]|uniref:Phenylalanyl-tRNA synthetase domain-containing protein n=1 Tax=Amborella trichopoda TaxID=13333 RepID=W1P209_AMBTC|nr:hypothetical protein AMTR_s00090p00035360 [Amborella trichopoda]
MDILKIFPLLMRRTSHRLALQPEEIDSLKRTKAWKGYSLRKGPNYTLKRTMAATDLTREQLQRGEWNDLEFKDYNFSALGQPTEGGHLHPLLKVRAQFRAIFLEMGFEEMPTNNFVESRTEIDVPNTEITD